MNDNINFVLIGHVDHGKSTCGGRILVDTNTVTQQEVNRAIEDSKNENMQSWWLAYLLDTGEERLKGKTHEHMIIPIKYKENIINMIDVPGHSKYVKEMIVGTSKANTCVLICSAKKGEIDDGIKGQTLEHLMIAKGMGINHLIIAINKMDHKTVEWSNDIYEEKKQKLNNLLKKFKFKNIDYIPISALHGDNIIHKRNDIEYNLLDLIIKNKNNTISNDIIKINNNRVNVKCIFFNIDNLITKGYQCVIHSSDQYSDCEIINIDKNFITKNTKGYVTIEIQLFNDMNIYKSIILRNDTKTIAMGIVIE